MRPFPGILVPSIILILIFLSSGCRKEAPTAAVPWIEITPGVLHREVKLSRNGSKMTLWLYKPKDAGSALLPCVFIAPAGSPLVWGIGFAEGDRHEHIPYAKAGMVVCGYSLDGAVREGASLSEMKKGMKAFTQAEAGYLNLQEAIKYVESNVSEADPNQFFLAGHSSAATAALYFASRDSRMKGCVAYAPACNVVRWVNNDGFDPYVNQIEGMAGLLKSASPHKNVKQLKCPMLVFVARDESVVSIEDIESYVAAAKNAGKDCTYLTVETGDHYDAMINEGIPAGIAWINQLRGSR